jgi:hypothetical protein
MPRAGHRHLLVLYTHILNRWWRALLLLGLVTLGLAGGLYLTPGWFPSLAFTPVSPTILLVVAGTGVFALLLAFFFLTVRKFAYVQPFDNYLLLVTPFLRLKIAYRRIRQASSVEITRLFPLKRYRGRKRAILRRLMKYNTAIVLELNGLPLSRRSLEMFLSPLFFPDKSPRLALVVPDWMKFSTELESFRSAWQDSQRPV